VVPYIIIPYGQVSLGVLGVKLILFFGGGLGRFLHVGGNFWIFDKCSKEFFFGTPTQLSLRLY
jgi:hypothetical protein